MDPSELCRALVRIAEDVGSRLLDVLSRGEAGRVLGRGAGGDETLLIDRYAEDLIIEGLRREFRSFIAISEESGVVREGEGGWIFVVDPVDGSKNSIRGIPFFSVSIAAAPRDELTSVTAAVVHMPALKATYWAVRGKGAYCNGRRIRVSGRKRLGGSLVVVSCRREAGRRAGDLLGALIERKAGIRVFGPTSCELCFLASGGCDAYVDPWFGLRPLDVAAAYLIASEAGAAVSVKGLKGSPRLSLDERLYFLAASSRDLLSEIEQIIGRLGIN